jgi:hypothetical protein
MGKTITRSPAVIASGRKTQNKGLKPVRSRRIQQRVQTAIFARSGQMGTPPPPHPPPPTPPRSLRNQTIAWLEPIHGGEQFRAIAWFDRSLRPRCDVACERARARARAVTLHAQLRLAERPSEASTRKRAISR